jgi:hypothetical protein
VARANDTAQRRAGAIVLLAACALPVYAGTASPDVAATFRTLASQNPWTCAVQEAKADRVAGWIAAPAHCAWQNRLRMRRWEGAGGTQPNLCVSAQAHWWAWMQARGSAVASARVWQRSWTSQYIEDQAGAERRVVLVQRGADGQWSGTEWRWNPSPRAATRRWQEGRWKLLTARAREFAQAAPGVAGPDAARRLHAALEKNIGARPGEAGQDVWQWQADSLCLTVDALALGAQQLHLSWSVDDSRHEQRAAMQLQLARRNPKASWITPFSMMPAIPGRKTGAKFYATWAEDAQVKGQLWIPTKSGGPLVRIRITTPVELPRAARGEQAEPAKVTHASEIIEHELTRLATRWSQDYE